MSGKTVFSTPEAAEEAFYRALSKGDLSLMMSVWAEDANIVCVHPGGKRLEGPEAVRASFEQMFAQSPGLQVQRSDLAEYHDQGLIVHVLHENIRIGRDQNFQPPIIATNVYRLTGNGWRMVVHHASPSRPASRPGAKTSLH